MAAAHTTAMAAFTTAVTTATAAALHINEQIIARAGL
jgi:hypothetical protein